MHLLSYRCSCNGRVESSLQHQMERRVNSLSHKSTWTVGPGKRSAWSVTALPALWEPRWQSSRLMQLCRCHKFSKFSMTSFCTASSFQVLLTRLPRPFFQRTIRTRPPTAGNRGNACTHGFHTLIQPPKLCSGRRPAAVTPTPSTWAKGLGAKSMFAIRRAATGGGGAQR
jgi:hypothetical protein